MLTMTKRKTATQALAEIEFLLDALNKLIYAQKDTALEIRAMQDAMLSQTNCILKQLRDTQGTLEYVKSYVGIDDFFREAKRQGIGSDTGRIE
jgi:hypothetical protein